MKSKFLFALLGIAAMFTGCSQENVESLTTDKATSFKVAVDEGIQTRAEPTVKPTRYIMEVYEGTTAEGTPVRVEQDNDNTLDIVLKDNQAYTILFWADYGTTENTDSKNEYDADDLKVVTVVAGKTPTEAAFAKAISFTGGSTETSVTLEHAVAQVNFVQTEALTSEDNQLVVKLPESYSLNVADNSVTKIAGEVTYTFNYNKKDAGTLGTSYIIAETGNNKTTMGVIDVTLNSESKKQASNVPFERNFCTNIKGAYSNLYDATLTATCDENWEASENEKSLDPVVGDYYYSDGTWSTELISQKTCIGIVVQAGRNASDGCTYTKKNGSTPMTAIRGYVLALNDAKNEGCVWGSKGTTVGTSTEKSDFNGYDNTKIIKNSNLGFNETTFPAAFYATNYETSTSAPNNSSGWFLPSSGQVINFMKAKNTLLPVIQKIPGYEGATFSANYWSSSEGDDTSTADMARMYFAMINGTLMYDKASLEYDVRVRAWLVF